MTARQDRDIHLLDYWNVLLKRRWVIYTTVTIVVLTVTLGTLLMQPVYTATTRLQIEPRAPNVLPFQEVLTSAPDQRSDFYQTQYGLIRSRRVAREVIVALALQKHPEFRDGSAERPAAEPGPDGGVPAKSVDRFLGRLTVTPVRNSRLVDVSFSAHDRELAARAANRVAQTYIAFNTQAEYNTSERASLSLTTQIDSLQEEIDTKEKELQAYAREHGIVALNEKQHIVLKKLNDLNDAYTQAQAIRIEREARYATLRQAEPGSLKEAMDSQLIQALSAKEADLTRRHAQLSAKFKPEWPEMVRLRREIDETRERLEHERRTIYEQVVGASENAYRAARTEELYLARSLEQQKRETQEFALKEIQYNNLKADIANRRSTLEALVKRQTETSSSAGLNELLAGNVRVVDAAEAPIRPSSPKVLFNILLSVITGLSLGVGLAFFFEYLDKSVKTSEEMHQAAGIPSLATIPLLRPEGTRLRIIRANGRESVPEQRVELVSHEDPKSKIAEAFRDLRTALLVSQPGGPPRSILVASTQPGEGKTAVALNLAITLAQIGRLVVLVDADLRKPRLHKLLDTPNDRGLSTYLGGAEAPWPEALHTLAPGIDLVTSGPLPPNPADLLDSDRFVLIRRELEERGYDHIIYDSPPVLAVADPSIMASRVDAVIMVVQAGVTGKDALAHAVRRLQHVKARIIGGVLNQIDLSQPGYYYGYRRYYGEPSAQAPPPDLGRQRHDQTHQA